MICWTRYVRWSGILHGIGRWRRPHVEAGPQGYRSRAHGGGLGAPADAPGHGGPLGPTARRGRARGAPQSRSGTPKRCTGNNSPEGANYKHLETMRRRRLTRPGPSNENEKDDPLSRDRQRYARGAKDASPFTTLAP